MGHLTHCCVILMLFCKSVAALTDPYVRVTNRVNNIERYVSTSIADFRMDMTILFDNINRINSSVFDLKEMFSNKMKNDTNKTRTEPVHVNATIGSSMSDRVSSSELSLQTHLMSVRNGFRAEKRARVQLTNDLDLIMQSLQEYNSSVNSKLRILESNLTGIAGTIVPLKEENRKSLTNLQMKLESKQISIENNMRILERNLNGIAGTIAALKEENRILLTNLHMKLESKQISIENNVRKLIEDTATKKTCSPMFEKHGNSCYLAVIIEATWLNAKLFCHLLGADLLKMDNKNEEKVVAAVLQKSEARTYPYFWIGGTDLMMEGMWGWLRTNGRLEGLDYYGWRIGEPNGDTTENCMMLYNDEKEGKWNDLKCDALKPFICETEL